MSVESLVAFTDEALAEHAHRRIDFELADVAEPLRAGFATHGYASERLVWMRHETARASAPDGIAVEEVPYNTVRPLRVGWFEEDLPGRCSPAISPRPARTISSSAPGSSPSWTGASRLATPSSSASADPQRSPRCTCAPTAAAAAWEPP
jgi:hypothetical protein